MHRTRMSNDALLGWIMASIFVPLAILTAVLVCLAGCQLTITRPPESKPPEPRPYYGQPTQPWQQPAWPPTRPEARY